MKSRFLFITSVLLLSSCEVMSERRAAEDSAPSQNVILNYFLSTQYATSDTDISNQMSGFFGQSISATSDSTLKSFLHPLETCDYTSTFKSSASPTRSLALGDLVISHGTGAATINASPDDGSWSFNGSLPPDDSYFIALAGISGTSQYTQSFSILDGSNSILAYVANTTTATAFKLPTPRIPVASDADYDLHVSRSQPFFLKVTPISGAQYIRVRMRDGSNRDTGDLTCYAAPNATISMMPSMMSTFRTGTDGILEIDQIIVSELANTAHVKQSVIVSATRQVHGTTEYIDGNNVLQKLQLGRLNIDP